MKLILIKQLNFDLHGIIPLSKLMINDGLLRWYLLSNMSATWLCYVIMLRSVAVASTIILHFCILSKL